MLGTPNPYDNLIPSPPLTQTPSFADTTHRDRSGHDHDRQLRVLEDLSFPEGRVDGFVHGEASETRAVRRHLLADRNVAREHLSASPYWRCRFSDEDWRQVKKDWVAEMEAEV